VRTRLWEARDVVGKRRTAALLAHCTNSMRLPPERQEITSTSFGVMCNVGARDCSSRQGWGVEGEGVCALPTKFAHGTRTLDLRPGVGSFDSLVLMVSCTGRAQDAVAVKEISVEVGVSGVCDCTTHVGDLETARSLILDALR
jgi:hypothetical protein